MRILVLFAPRPPKLLEGQHDDPQLEALRDQEMVEMQLFCLSHPFANTYCLPGQNPSDLLPPNSGPKIKQSCCTFG